MSADFDPTSKPLTHVRGSVPLHGELATIDHFLQHELGFNLQAAERRREQHFFIVWR